VLFERALHPVQQRATGQAETGRQLDHGKTAAGLLRGGLGPHLLVGRGVGHGQAGAVDDVDAPTQPVIRAGGLGRELFGQMLVSGFELGQRQPGARLTIGSGAAVALRPALRRIPRLHLADDLVAGTARTQDLTEKSPERQFQRIKAFPAVEAVRARGQEIGGQPRSENLAQAA